MDLFRKILGPFLSTFLILKTDPSQEYLSKNRTFTKLPKQLSFGTLLEIKFMEADLYTDIEFCVNN